MASLIAYMCEDEEQCHRETVAEEDDSDTDIFSSFYVFSSVIFN